MFIIVFSKYSLFTLICAFSPKSADKNNHKQLFRKFQKKNYFLNFSFFLGTVSQLGVGSLLSSSIGDSKISAAMTRAAHNKAQVRIL